MTRPRTKGDPIQFRLPLGIYGVLEERARAKGVTPSRYVEIEIVRVLRGADRVEKPEANIRSQEVTAMVEPRPKADKVQEANGTKLAGATDCDHRQVTKMMSGVWRCDRCSAVSTNRGASWRSP